MDPEVKLRRSSVTSDIVYKEANYRMLDDIRIVPEKLVFNDAFDGKIYNSSFSIINCGKYSAFVRVLPPGSKIFKMKPLPKGMNLPAGLSLTRKVSYTHKSAMVLPQSFLFIYINEKRIFYEIEVNLISSLVSLTPDMLDFGELDVGNSSKQMTVQLINRGHKTATFSVDLGRNDLELIVEPMKGTIKPVSAIGLTVEVLGSQLGTFTKVFWIKTEPPQRVKISGIFISPKLVLEYPVSTFGLKMIDFPKTYYGAKSKRTLVIQNRSSTNSMFCTIAERGTTVDCLDAVRQTNDNLKFFFVNPKEGRLNAQEKYILQYAFVPKKMKHFHKKYCVAIIKIKKINYRDGFVVGQYSASSLQTIEDFFNDAPPVTSYIRICLYGEMEEASVKLTPTAFYLSHIKLHEIYEREFDIKNNSKYLPIIIKYNKEMCIEMDPKEVHLSPNRSMEVKLYIRPSKIGEFRSKIKMDLIYHDAQNDEYYNVGATYLSVHYCASMTSPKIEPKFNMGITPMLKNEVGYFVDDVRFNTNVDKPRQAIISKNLTCFNNNNNALIAFPNDRPRSLRPWKNTVPVRTIFANIPRITTDCAEHVLNAAETGAKQFTKSVYTAYLQSRVKTRQMELLSPYKKTDYDSEGKHLLLEKFVSRTYVAHNPITSFSRFIPLPPEILMSVIIKPKYVRLGEIAPYTMCTDCFTIENRNEFPITVSIKALNNSIVIKEKKRMVIQAKKIKNIFFNCYSHDLGKYYVPVFILINKCHIFDATVFAKVIPTTVKCKFEDIAIDPKINKTLFQIYNPVNCNITFCWEVQDSNFDMNPKSGIIPPRRSIFCRLMFLPQNMAILKTEIYLVSQSGARQVITVGLKQARASICFDTELVKFDDIPLNIPVSRKLILRNFSDVRIMYKITNPDPIRQITINPREGEIYAKSDMHFKITAHFKSVVEFNCSVEFLVQDIYRYVVNIEGNVVFPSIKLEPRYIQLHKIISGAYIRRIFRVTNMSKIQTFIHFPLEDIPEFFITDLNRNYVNKVVALEPKESRELFLEFKPIEPVAYSIFLPYIINGIMGPPALNDPATLNPVNYFEDWTENDNYSRSTTKAFKTLSTLSIRCAAEEAWFKFSSLHLHLCSVDNTREKYFTIKNISVIQHYITIPMVDLKGPFSFEIVEASNYETKQGLYKIIMEPKDTVTFKIEYNPSEYGHYDVNLPIFVEKYFDKCPFNFLKLSGSNPKPSISCSEYSLFFHSIWVKEKICENITLNLVKHQEDCKIITKIENETLSIKLLEKTILTRHNSKLVYLITFDPIEECFLDYEIIFSCTCCSDISCSLFVKACADESSFVSYHSLLQSQALLWPQKFTTTFPYFPENSNVSFYANRMRILLNTLEKWIFSQGFFFKNFFQIPLGISSFPVIIEQKSLKRFGKKPELTLPLVQLMVNLVDTSILKFIKDENVTETYEGVEGIIYVYTIYRNIISFLRNQRIFVPQLEPEYLLPYNNYVIFRERLFNEEDQCKGEVLNEKQFYLFSKQCWIDLLTRIYKVFVFNRIINPTPIISKARSKAPPPKQDIYREELMQYYSENLKYFTHRSENEAKLLLWIEFHFEKQKFVLWDTENINQTRKFRSFTNDLRDGLPFLTLMLSYCPYMIKDLKNCYPNFQNDEQIFHNACLIYESWRKIHLSFDITPSSIVKPITIEMIFLITYLYDVLPNFYPTETITLEASLGETTINELILRNHGNVTIAYTAVFFSNDSNVFQVEPKTIIIPPRKEKKLKITYVAKNVMTKTAVLVLSGETASYNFSRSMAITLVGTPSIFKFSQECNIQVDTYERVRKKLEILSPYEKAYIATVSFHIGDESYFESDNQFVPVSTLELAPMQMNVDPIITFDEDGEAILKISMCYLINGSFTYFIYFVNEETGDFCIKVTILSVLHKENTLKSEVVLPTYFDPTAPCLCQHFKNSKDLSKVNCPKIFTVKIPCKNVQLFDGLRSMMEYFCDEHEFLFWKALLDYPKGLHVLRKYMSHTFDERLIKYGNALKPNVTYDLELSANISGPEKITLENVSTDDTYILTLHWNGKGIPKDELLMLTAEHGQEKRQYELIFVIPKEVLERMAQEREESKTIG